MTGWLSNLEHLALFVAVCGGRRRALQLEQEWPVDALDQETAVHVVLEARGNLELKGRRSFATGGPPGSIDPK